MKAHSGGSSAWRNVSWGRRAGIDPPPSVDRLVMEAIRVGEPRRESIQMSRSASAGREMKYARFLSRNSARHEGSRFLFRDVTHVAAMEKCGGVLWRCFARAADPLSIFRDILETLLDDPHQPPANGFAPRSWNGFDRLNALGKKVLTCAIESPCAELDLSEVDLAEVWRTGLCATGGHDSKPALKSQLDVPGDLPLRRPTGRLQDLE